MKKDIHVLSTLDLEKDDRERIRKNSGEIKLTVHPDPVTRMIFRMSAGKKLRSFTPGMCCPIRPRCRT